MHDEKGGDDLSPLTFRQRLFVEEYMRDGNATQAAIRAGYNPKTAKSIASENLTKPDIVEAVNAAVDARVLRTRVCADAVIEKAMAIVCFDIRVLFDDNGHLRSVKDLPEEAAQVLAGMDVTKVKVRGSKNDKYAVTTKIRLPDRNAAIATLLRHLIGMQVNVSGTVKPERIEPLPVDEITAKFQARKAE